MGLIDFFFALSNSGTSIAPPTDTDNVLYNDGGELIYNDGENVKYTNG